MSTTRARLDVLLAAVCFGTTGTAQALGPDGASPVAVGAGRVAVGAAALLLVAALSAAGARAGEDGLHRLRHVARRRAVWAGGLGVAGYQLTFFLAVHLTGVAVGTVVALGSAPVVTGALAWAIGRRRPGRRWAAATALAAAGLAVLTLSAGTGQVRPLGVVLALGAGVSYAVYTLGTKQLLDTGVPSPTAVAAVFTAGAVLLAPSFLVIPVAWMGTWRGAATVLWLGLVPTALAYVLFARGLRRLSAAEVSTLTLAEPLTAAAFGILLLGEPLTTSTLAGGALLLAGLGVLAVRPRGPDGVPATGRAPTMSGAS